MPAERRFTKNDLPFPARRFMLAPSNTIFR